MRREREKTGKEKEKLILEDGKVGVLSICYFCKDNEGVEKVEGRQNLILEDAMVFRIRIQVECV